jgi:acyl-CoA reductase-like NAD-dependent aldehyde dehydrogenase
MPSESPVVKTHDANAPMSSDAPLINAAQKAAATIRRRTQDQRAESLREIREQIAAGTLVIRYMSAAERTQTI